jgi:hypothetical protein
MASSCLPDPNQRGRRIPSNRDFVDLATGAQAEAYATEKRRAFNGTIKPSSFAGHGMPCPY